MPENYLDMIPRMAARTWTGAPAEVFYNMYEDGEDFTSSMTQHIQSRFGEYDDPLEFDDMELYNIDEFAVEKAAYQQQFDFPVAGTPWGAPLTPEEPVPCTYKTLSISHSICHFHPFGAFQISS